MSIEEKVGDIYEDQGGALVNHPKAADLKEVIVQLIENGFMPGDQTEIDAGGFFKVTKKIVRTFKDNAGKVVFLIDFVVEDL